jgi:hypothetical protein
MLIHRALLAAVVLGMSAAAAAAGTTTATLTITVQAPFQVVFTPAAPTIPCNAAAGSVVAGLSTTGGDGNAPTFAATAGDTSDFAVSGTNVVVGTNGIAQANCGKTSNLTITATQP